MNFVDFNKFGSVYWKIGQKVDHLSLLNTGHNVTVFARELVLSES